MANALGNNGGRLYSFASQPVLIDCNFVIDSANGNGLGIRNLKGQGVQAVYMNTTAGAPTGTPALGSARSYSILAASAISNTGSSVLSGNIGLAPGTSVTGFPPGTFSGAENVNNPAVVLAQSQALAAYNDLHSRASTVIPSELGGQTLVPGVYSFASGAATLSGSLGALTLNGNGVYVIQTATTLGTGASGTPVINLTGGAQAANVYFVVGSSATLNISGSGIMQGNVIAATSVTVDGGSVNGSLIALGISSGGAVTLSAAVAGAVQPLPSNSSNPVGPGLAWVQLTSNYNRYLGGFSGFVSPTTGSPLAINGSALTVGNPYVIASVGNPAEGQATISPVADVSGSLASKYFTVYDAYGNTWIIWFSVSGVGARPLLGNAAPDGVAGLHYVQQSILQNATAAQIGAALVLTLENLPSGINGVLSFTASGSSVVTIVNTSQVVYHLPGSPMDGIAPLATGFAFALTVDDHNLKDWQGVGVPPGIVPAVGVGFVAKASGFGLSSGLAISPGVSGDNSIEVIGDPNQTIAPIPQGGSPNVGGWILVQMLSNGVRTAPADGSVCGMCFYVDAKFSPSNVGF